MMEYLAATDASPGNWPYGIDTKAHLFHFKKKEHGLEVNMIDTQRF